MSGTGPGSPGTLTTVPDAQTSRWSTRQLLPPTLVFLAALFATVAIASPTLLAPQLARVSLDTSLVTTSKSTAPTATFDRCSLDRPTAAATAPRTLIRNQRVAVVRPADRTVATLQSGTVIRRDAPAATGCTDPILSAVVDRVTISRTTAKPTGESSVQTDSTRPAAILPDRTGLTYLFAPRFHDDDLSFFDPITRRTVSLQKLGDDTVDGLSVVRLRADIPDTNLATLPGADPRSRITKPASWFGWPSPDPATPITADAHQSGRYTLSVDKRSGLIVDAEIVVRRDYRAWSGPKDAGAGNGVNWPKDADDRSLPDFNATFRFDAATRSSLAEAARSQARPAWLAGRIVPLVAVLGAVVVAAAAWTLRRRSAD